MPNFTDYANGLLSIGYMSHIPFEYVGDVLSWIILNMDY